MSRFLTITNSNSANFGERKKTVRPNSIKVGNVTLNFLVAALVCLLGVFYIFEVNNMATKGYEIKSLENQINDLKKDNEKLKIQSAELKSMYNIEEKTKDLNMVVPKDTSYLNIPGDMAMR
jgi:cell division protein FtsL